MTDIKTILKKRKRRTATVEVCLRGDLAGEYEALERELANLPAGNKLGGDPRKAELQQKMEQVRAEMAEGTITFRLEAVPDDRFQEIVDEHPPRRAGDDVDPRDARTMVNGPAFNKAVIRACTVEPELDDDDWELLLGPDGMSSGEKMRLATEATRICSQPVDVPFSSAASNGNPS